jgi:hypothetical protein
MNEKTLTCLILFTFFICCFFVKKEQFKIKKTWPMVTKDQWGENISWVKDNEGKWKTILNASNPIGTY